MRVPIVQHRMSVHVLMVQLLLTLVEVKELWHITTKYIIHIQLILFGLLLLHKVWRLMLHWRRSVWLRGPIGINCAVWKMPRKVWKWLRKIRLKCKNSWGCAFLLIYLPAGKPFVWAIPMLLTKLFRLWNSCIRRNSSCCCNTCWWWCCCCSWRCCCCSTCSSTCRVLRIITFLKASSHSIEEEWRYNWWYPSLWDHTYHLYLQLSDSYQCLERNKNPSNKLNKT